MKKTIWGIVKLIKFKNQSSEVLNTVYIQTKTVNEREKSDKELKIVRNIKE